MTDFEDYFGGLSEKQYIEETNAHFNSLDHLSKCNDFKTELLLSKFRDNLFSIEFVSDEEAEMLYHTILNWKEKADMYDAECD